MIVKIVIYCDYYQVRTGELQFDWDEAFELDLVDNRQLDVLVYSWDPQHRHKLCYRGAVTLPDLLSRAASHQLAIKVKNPIRKCRLSVLLLFKRRLDIFWFSMSTKSNLSTKV